MGLGMHHGTQKQVFCFSCSSADSGRSVLAHLVHEDFPWVPALLVSERGWGEDCLDGRSRNGALRGAAVLNGVDAPSCGT